MKKVVFSITNVAIRKPYSLSFNGAKFVKSALNSLVIRGKYDGVRLP